MSTIRDKLNLLISNKEAIKAAIIEMGVSVGDNMSDYADAIRSITTSRDALLVSVTTREEYDVLSQKESNKLYLLLNEKSEVVSMFIGDIPLKFVSYESG